MGYNTALAVSLAVGIPVVAVIVGYVCFYIRRRKILQEEDATRTDIDVGLEDNALFVLFGEQLHCRIDRPADDQEKEHKSLSLTAAPSVLEFNTGEPLPKVFMKKAFVAPGDSEALSCRSTYKSASAYDFYDTFIPVFDDNKKLTQPPAIKPEAGQGSSSNRSSRHASLDLSQKNKSLDALALQLHNPLFYLKLLFANHTQSRLATPLNSGAPSLTELVKPSAPGMRSQMGSLLGSSNNVSALAEPVDSAKKLLVESSPKKTAAAPTAV